MFPSQGGLGIEVAVKAAVKGDLNRMQFDFIVAYDGFMLKSMNQIISISTAAWVREATDSVQTLLRYPAVCTNCCCWLGSSKAVSQLSSCLYSAFSGR